MWRALDVQPSAIQSLLLRGSVQRNVVLPGWLVEEQAKRVGRRPKLRRSPLGCPFPRHLPHVSRFVSLFSSVLFESCGLSSQVLCRL